MVSIVPLRSVVLKFKSLNPSPYSAFILVGTWFVFCEQRSVFLQIWKFFFVTMGCIWLANGCILWVTFLAQIYLLPTPEGVFSVKRLFLTKLSMLSSWQCQLSTPVFVVNLSCCDHIKQMVHQRITCTA